MWIVNDDNYVNADKLKRLYFKHEGDLRVLVGEYLDDSDGIELSPAVSKELAARFNQELQQQLMKNNYWGVPANIGNYANSMPTTKNCKEAVEYRQQQERLQQEELARQAAERAEQQRQHAAECERVAKVEHEKTLRFMGRWPEVKPELEPVNQ